MQKSQAFICPLTCSSSRPDLSVPFLSFAPYHSFYCSADSSPCHHRRRIVPTALGTELLGTVVLGNILLDNSLLDYGLHWRSLVLHWRIAVLGGDVPSFGVVLGSVNRGPHQSERCCYPCFRFDLHCERRKLMGASTHRKARCSDALTAFALIAAEGHIVLRIEHVRYYHCMVLDLGIHCSGE